LMATMELGEQLRRIADPGQRRREMCDFMLRDQFRGQAALVMHVDRATPDRPQVLCSARSESAKGQAFHISTTLLRNVMEKGRALMANNTHGRIADVELSIAPEFMRISAAACPMNVNEQGMDVLYVAFPPELAQREWLALTSLVATQFEQSESIWSAQRDVAANAAIDYDLRQARNIKQRLVPREIVIPGLDIGISFEPCRWVGGDYVDVVSMSDGRTLLAVADACGKGLQAALLVSSVHTLVRGSIRARSSLGDLMTALNDYLCDYVTPGSFVTMLAVVVDSKTGKLEYASAGHPSGSILGKGGESRQLASTGFPLGISPQPIPTQTDHLADGELLAMFTDGFTEIPGPSGNMFESAEFYNLIQTAWAKSADGAATTFVQTVTSLLGKFMKGASAADDQTFLAVRRT
jgi:phosphoserine phosphatase RsbU/P